MVMAGGTGTVTSKRDRRRGRHLIGGSERRRHLDRYARTVTADVGSSSSISADGAGVARLRGLNAAAFLVCHRRGRCRRRHRHGRLGGDVRTLPSRSRPMSATMRRSRVALSPSARSPPSLGPATPPMRRRSRPAAACSMASRPPIRRRPKMPPSTPTGARAWTLPSANVTIAAENDSSQDMTGDRRRGRLHRRRRNCVTQTSSERPYGCLYLGAGAITVASDLGVLLDHRDRQRQQHGQLNSGLEAGSSPAPRPWRPPAPPPAPRPRPSTATEPRITLYFGGLGINATHTTNYSDNGDAYQASAVGASGGNGTNTVVSNVTAEGGHQFDRQFGRRRQERDRVRLRGHRDQRRRARGIGRHRGRRRNAERLDRHAKRHREHRQRDDSFSLNDDPSSSTAKINIEAYNEPPDRRHGEPYRGRLARRRRGPIRPDGDRQRRDQYLGQSELFSAGDLDIGTASQMLAANDANANLYGLVSGAGASTNTSLTANQNVSIGASTLEAWGPDQYLCRPKRRRRQCQWHQYQHPDRRRDHHRLQLRPHPDLGEIQGLGHG